MTYPDNFDAVSVEEDGDAVNVESEERCRLFLDGLSATARVSENSFPCAETGVDIITRHL